MSGSVEVPFTLVGNRRCLTAIQLVEDPELARFVARFPQCFAVDLLSDVYWFYPDGDAPEYASFDDIGGAVG